MTVKQRALIQTVMTFLGICAVGIVGGWISTLMTAFQFYLLLLVIGMGVMFYLIYTWNLTTLEMAEKFGRERKDQ